MNSLRDTDRFWWAMILAGLACCVAAVVGPWYFGNRFAADAPYDTPGDYMLTALLGLLFLILAAAAFTTAAQARDRRRKRLAALHGDLSGMPLTTIQPDPAQAPDVSAQPLEVMWRMSSSSAIGYLLIIGLQCLSLLVTLGAIPYLLIASLFTPSMRAKPVSVSEIAVTVATTIVFVALVVVAIRYLGRGVPTLFGRPFGVRATSDGIEGHTEYGARSFIAWDEVRLFEVMGPQGYAARSFALYAPGKSVIWREYRTGIGSEYAPAGATASENALRQAALLNLITARTGLEPRTFTKALRRDLIGVPASSPQVGALALAIFAPFLWALAISEYFFPITPYGWANLPSVAALSLLGLLLAVFAIMTAIRRRRAGIPSEPPTVAAPSLDTPDIAYSLTWRGPAAPSARRVSFAAVGALLLVNLMPAVIAVPQAFSIDTTAPANPLAVLWGFILGAALGIMGFVGLIMLLAPLVVLGGRSNTVSIRADVAGLSHGAMSTSKLIPWSMMREIIWQPRGLGGYPSYALVTDDPVAAITWPTAPNYLAAAPPDGAMPIGPDELAALVAARIGRPIRVNV